MSTTALAMGVQPAKFRTRIASVSGVPGRSSRMSLRTASASM
jgi:hypothetical protein